MKFYYTKLTILILRTFCLLYAMLFKYLVLILSLAVIFSLQLRKIFVEYFLKSRASVNLADDEGLTPLHVAALENHDRGDTTHLVIHGRLDTIVDIDLADLGTPLVRLCQLVNDRYQLATGTTPGSPEINQNRLIRLQDLAGKCIVGQFQNVAHRQLLAL